MREPHWHRLMHPLDCVYVPAIPGVHTDLGYLPGSLRATELVYNEVLSLPMGPHLSDEQVEMVYEATIDAGNTTL